jgi:hypothetical protein
MFQPHTKTPLPMIHVYCFQNPDTASEMILQEVRQALGYEIDETELTLHNVRNVSPKKARLGILITLIIGHVLLYIQTPTRGSICKRKRKINFNILNSIHAMVFFSSESHDLHLLASIKCPSLYKILHHNQCCFWGIPKNQFSSFNETDPGLICPAFVKITLVRLVLCVT